MFTLPKSDPTDAIKLADWIELNALISPDLNYSRGDLERALNAAALKELPNNESIESKCVEVFSELSDRAFFASDGYPFELTSPSLLQAKDDYLKYTPYVFCLCLSYFGWSAQDNPAKMFERIAGIAAKEYIGGYLLEFGAPRSGSPVPKGFADAVKYLCKMLKEGDSISDSPLEDEKDDGIDIVAWKPFVDGLPGKLVLFGQCATGENWDTKLSEMQPQSFCKKWMRKPLESEPIRSFFMPHRLNRRSWSKATHDAGIIFERCRIAFWAQKEASPSIDFAPVSAWIQAKLISM
ncbi:hypothetical protein [Hymenobacter sp. B81]|uniref:hypothetical protein n=1 Tax=Hymenobacter sp. B81 TaxID=3344878 RepID=UPI0037DC4C50